jgi:hypothetical protein
MLPPESHHLVSSRISTILRTTGPSATSYPFYLWSWRLYLLPCEHTLPRSSLDGSALQIVSLQTPSTCFSHLSDSFHRFTPNGSCLWTMSSILRASTCINDFQALYIPFSIFLLQANIISPGLHQWDIRVGDLLSYLWVSPVYLCLTFLRFHIGNASKYRTKSRVLPNTVWPFRHLPLRTDHPLYQTIDPSPIYPGVHAK